jgi:hypothetical protein
MELLKEKLVSFQDYFQKFVGKSGLYTENRDVLIALFSVLRLPVGTGRPRPPLSKKSIDFDHEIMENETKVAILTMKK